MEITGIYQAQKNAIESLEKEISRLNSEGSRYMIRYNKLLEQYSELEKKYNALVETHNLVKAQKEFYKDKPRQEYTPHVIELTRQQIYHIVDFIEDNASVESVVLKMSHESGIGTSLTTTATVKIDLTDHSDW